MSGLPTAFKWDGESMHPIGRFVKEADRIFVIGQTYSLIEEELDTSEKSRRHFFACVRDAWATLPESVSPQFPTSEVLRKHALIRTGFCNSHQTVCATKGEALRLAAALNAITDASYAIVAVDGCVVTRLTAKSQAMRAMKTKEFQASKDAVFGFVASLLGVTADDIAKNEAA